MDPAQLRRPVRQDVLQNEHDVTGGPGHVEEVQQLVRLDDPGPETGPPGQFDDRTERVKQPPADDPAKPPPAGRPPVVPDPGHAEPAHPEISAYQDRVVRLREHPERPDPDGRKQPYAR